MRHRGPDGSVWVRTYPLTLLHDHTLPTHTHDWDQLTYAAAGVLRVSTADASWIVPPHRAVWVPAGVAHAEQMFAPVSVRTLYLAPRIARALPRECADAQRLEPAARADPARQPPRGARPRGRRRTRG